MNIIKPFCILSISLLILLPFLNCGSSKKDTSFALTTKTPFTIGYGNIQEWFAGLQGGGSGIDLVLYVEGVGDGVVFQKLYFRNQISEVKQTTPKRIQGNFKGTSNRDIVMDSNPLNESGNTPPEAFPFALLQDEALLEYTFNGKTHYTKLSSLVKEKTIAYPSAPPNNNN